MSPMAMVRPGMTGSARVRRGGVPPIIADGGRGGSLPAEQGVQGPAAAGVWPRPAQVGQQDRVGATRLLRGVGEDRQVAEAVLLVNRLAELPDGGGESCGTGR